MVGRPQPMASTAELPNDSSGPEGRTNISEVWRKSAMFDLFPVNLTRSRTSRSRASVSRVRRSGPSSTLDAIHLAAQQLGGDLHRLITHDARMRTAAETIGCASS